MAGSRPLSTPRTASRKKNVSSSPYASHLNVSPKCLQRTLQAMCERMYSGELRLIACKQAQRATPS